MKPSSFSTIHFVGIGGAGMSVLAHMFSALGVTVTGSDALETQVVRALREEGINVQIPQSADNVGQADAVIVSSAIRDDNPELVEARERNIPLFHRSQALALLMRDRKAVAVAGAHGKTTTSAMIAVGSMMSGLDASFAIGGSVHTTDGPMSGGRVGTGDVLVAEADESDGSFLNYEPYIAVVTNVEPDHLDHYGTKEAFEQAFVSFAGHIQANGVLIACADDPGAAQLAAAHVNNGKRTWTYGQDPTSSLRLVDLTQVAGTSKVRLSVAWETLETSAADVPQGHAEFDIAAPGLHNALNATGAFAALLYLGVDPTRAAHALEQFSGTGRRFEERGMVRSIRVVDDYAHHPTEVAALLRAARISAGNGRVGVVFQPHLYSRTRIFSTEFAQAFDLADFTVMCDIYAAREDHDPQVTPHMIAEHMNSPVKVILDKTQAAHALADWAQPGDLVLTVGAGDVTELGAVILDRLAKD